MKKLNWLADSPPIPIPQKMEEVYFPLSEAREFLKDFDDATIKQIAIKLKEYFVDKAGTESFTFKTLFGDYIFRNGIQFFLFDILSSTYIPFRRAEILARKEGRATIFDRSEENKNKLPPPFDKLTFYEILSILKNKYSI